MYTLLLQDNVAVKQKHDPLWLLMQGVLHHSCFYTVILAYIESCINYSDALTATINFIIRDEIPSNMKLVSIYSVSA